MDWKDIGSGILNFAPTIAKALGVPGFIADGAAGVLKGVLGLGTEATAQDVQAELAKLTPADYVKLREADLTYKQNLLDAGVKLEEIAMQDRDSARKNQASTQSKTPDILMFVLTVGFFGLLALMWWRPPPPECKDMLMVMVGTLGTAWTAGVTFFYGSSQGSDRLKGIIAAGAE
jgi:hypothetical protein